MDKLFAIYSKNIGNNANLEYTQIIVSYIISQGRMAVFKVNFSRPVVYHS